MYSDELINQPQTTAGVSNSRPVARMCQELAMSTPGLAKGKKVATRHVTT